MESIELLFQVDPKYLTEHTYVKNPVKVQILKPNSKLMSRYLGASGKRMAKAGFPFYFEESIAKELLKKKVACLI